MARLFRSAERMFGRGVDAPRPALDGGADGLTVLSELGAVTRVRGHNRTLTPHV